MLTDNQESDTFQRGVIQHCLDETNLLRVSLRSMLVCPPPSTSCIHTIMSQIKKEKENNLSPWAAVACNTICSGNSSKNDTFVIVKPERSKLNFTSSSNQYEEDQFADDESDGKSSSNSSTIKEEEKEQDEDEIWLSRKLVEELRLKDEEMESLMTKLKKYDELRRNLKMRIDWFGTSSN